MTNDEAFYWDRRGEEIFEDLFKAYQTNDLDRVKTLKDQLDECKVHLATLGCKPGCSR